MTKTASVWLCRMMKWQPSISGYSILIGASCVLHSSQQQWRNPHISHFLKLPRELQDLVYHFLWRSHPHQVVAYSNRKTILRYTASNHTCSENTHDHQWTPTLPEWLFINKAFHIGTYPNTGTSTLFGTEQPEIKCERHDEEVTRRPTFVDKKTAWHWYEFSRPVLQ